MSLMEDKSNKTVIVVTKYYRFLLLKHTHTRTHARARRPRPAAVSGSSRPGQPLLSREAAASRGGVEARAAVTSPTERALRRCRHMPGLLAPYPARQRSAV